ncbi:MAG: hypothetical protein J1F12_06315 [Muribaculaceae bacterium]|nr:hypothetical protein [Muribaculaceae bacterium]
MMWKNHIGKTKRNKLILSSHLKIQLLILFCSLFFLNSCGNSKDSRWIKTEEGIEYFLPEDKKPSLLTFGKYYWSGDSVAGLAYGNGTLKFEDTWNSKNNYSIKGFAHFGEIQPRNEDNLYKVGVEKDYLLTGYGAWTRNDTTIIGNFKKGEAQGEAKIYRVKEPIYLGNLKNSQPDGKGILYSDGKLLYDGKFKKGLFSKKGTLYYTNGNILYEGGFKEGKYNGKGTLFYPDGTTIFYKGHFKNGEFDGKGEINVVGAYLDSIKFKPMNELWKIEALRSGNFTIDSVTNNKIFTRDSNAWINETHVFENGMVKPLHAEYYQKLNNLAIETNPELYESVYDRINSWETSAWWKYLIVIIVLSFLWLISLGLFYEEDRTDYKGNVREKAELYGRIKKWSYWNVYPVWLIGGWFGYHRAILKSRGTFIYALLFTILALVNLRNIVLFLFWPSSWKFMDISTFSVVLAAMIVLFLIIDLAWIPWRCYWLNHVYYRHDLREKELIASNKTDVDSLITDIQPKVKTTIGSLNSLLEKTKQVQSKNYSGNKSSFNLKRIASVTFGKDEWANFELQRLNSLEKVLKDYTRTQNNFADLAKNLNIYLEEARNNAYRNINLTKELIGWMRKINTKGTMLEKDRELHSEYSSFDFSTLQMPEIELGVDFDSTCRQCVKTTNLLMSAGLRLGPSLAIGAAISLIGHIADALQKAQRLCEEANEKSRLAVKGIGESLDNIVKSEADILRAYEILASLNKANKAFIRVYAPLRDAYTGSSPSFSYFIRGGVKIPERNYKEDLILLQQVTSEYNKINQAKL